MAILIRELTPETLTDYLGFFDTVAFSDNPDWASCYCQCFVFTGSREIWATRTAEENRRSAAERVQAGVAEGLLAYENGVLVGWCQTGRLAAIPGLVAALGLTEPPEPGAVVVTCFVVAPSQRRRGLARRLLDEVVSRARARGAPSVYGYPHPDREDSAADRFPGPRRLFEDHHFDVVGATRNRVIMRLRLTPPPSSQRLSEPK